MHRAEAGRAVPPGRLGYDLRDDVLLLHTIQDAVVLDALLRDGGWHPDPDAGDSEFAPAYAWMHDQMSARLGVECGSAVWLWAKTTRHELVQTCHRSARGDGTSVLLTCRIPRGRVLLSHFEDWHWVLNDWLYLPRVPGESVDEWLDRTDAPHSQFWSELDVAREEHGAGGEFPRRLWPDDLRARVESSWPPILDPQNYLAHAGDRRSWPGVWQATTPWLLAADVVEAVRLERPTRARLVG